MDLGGHWGRGQDLPFGYSLLGGPRRSSGASGRRSFGTGRTSDVGLSDLADHSDHSDGVGPAGLSDLADYLTGRTGGRTWRTSDMADSMTGRRPSGSFSCAPWTPLGVPTPAHAWQRWSRFVMPSPSHRLLSDVGTPRRGVQTRPAMPPVRHLTTSPSASRTVNVTDVPPHRVSATPTAPPGLPGVPRSPSHPIPTDPPSATRTHA